jgi:hypothetical protein
MFPWLKLLPQWLFNNYITRAKAIGVQMETLYVEIMFLLAIEDLVHKGPLIVAIFPSLNDLFQNVDVGNYGNRCNATSRYVPLVETAATVAIQ